MAQAKDGGNTGRRRRGSPLALPLLLSLASSPASSSSDAMPTAASCPSCVSGRWGCERPCPAANKLRSYKFDFRYKLGQCWEEIPKDGRSIIVDVDLWCSMQHTQLFLSCDNMNDYDTTGIAIVQDCKANSNGADLVKESCAWACKHGRPVARCLWEFAHAGTLRNSRLKNCWLAEECAGVSADVTVMCEPHTTFNVSAEVGVLQGDLQAALLNHQAAEQRVIEANKAHEVTKAQKASSLSAEAVAEQREKDKAELKDSQETLALARERLSGVMAELNETRNHLEANQTLHKEVKQNHKQDQEKLQGMLTEASAELSKSRDVVESLNYTNQQQAFAHSHQRRSLMGEIALYRAKLIAEQAAHNATKSALEAESDAADEAEAHLRLALVGLGFVMILCGGSGIFLLMRARKWRSLAITSLTEQASNMGTQVVMGRPIGMANSNSVDDPTLKGAYPVKPDGSGAVDLPMAHPSKEAWT